MKKIICILLALLPLISFAKDDKGNRSNPKYLAGAVTMNEEGKVAFTKEIQIPSKSKEAIYNDLLKWANERFQIDEKNNMHARVIYKDLEKGIIAATGEEYIVFYSNALALDRTRIFYQFTFFIEEAKCKMEMSKIRFLYDENRDGGERYEAEEWIVDDMALNKKKTKLSPISGKFRRKTIDLKDELFDSATKAASGGQVIETAQEMKAEPTVEVKAQPVVAPVVAAPVVKEVVPATPVQPAQAAKKELQEINISQVNSNLGDIASSGRLTITAGEEEVDVKAEAWGGFGKLFNKDVTYTLIDKSRIAVSLLMENCNTYKISFYQAGSTEPSVVVECKKSMKQELSSDEVKSLNSQIDTNKQYLMYIGEVVRCLAR